MPFLDAAATPRLWRSFYVPHFGPKGTFTYDVCTEGEANFSIKGRLRRFCADMGGGMG